MSLACPGLDPGNRYGIQGIARFLTPIFDPEFSDFSYGFRPGRSAHDAVFKLREYIRQGYRIAVNHDVLIHRGSRKVHDKRLLRLIGKYLRAGVKVKGRLQNNRMSVPQGGPVSPLLANLFLHYAFDYWMQRKYPHVPFERYADDMVCHCRTES
jgi:RNA-directed DNA polymerase